MNRITFIVAFLAMMPLLLTAQTTQLTGKPIGTTSVDYSTGKASTTVNTPANAFDNDPNTFYASYQRSYGWVGMDLEEKHVITRIYYRPRQNWGSRLELGVFEGANKPDFSDAVPLFVIPKEVPDSRLSFCNVYCSRAFRYVRYVGPNDSRCNISEIKFYGTKAEGDDSQLYIPGSLPVVTIHTEKGGDITSKEIYQQGVVSIISDGGKSIYSDSLNIRGRGNGSWTFPQKPYKLKLFHKKRVLGFPAKAKQWTLINTYRDKTLMRNLIAFEASRLLKLPYTPACTLVDVFLNGEYKGIYQLTDQLEVRKNRIDVEEMTPEDNSLPNLGGGYFIEVDNYANQEKSKFYSARFGTPVTIKYPKDDEITPAQAQYIKNAYDRFESRTFLNSYTDPNVGFASLLDVESYLKRFIGMEFTGNTDAYFSVHMYKKRNDPKFYTSPLWDCDLAFDNDSRTYPINSMTTFVSLSDKCSTVAGMKQMLNRILGVTKKEMSAYWSEARNNNDFTAEHFTAYIDSIAKAVDASQKLHYTRWKTLNTIVTLTVAARGSYKAEVDFVKDWIGKRIAWMDNKIGLIPTAVTDLADATIGNINGSEHCIMIRNFKAGSLLQIYKPDGTCIVSRKTAQANEDVQIPAGFYIVKVTEPDGKDARKKVLVQ